MSRQFFSSLNNRITRRAKNFQGRRRMMTPTKCLTTMCCFVLIASASAFPADRTVRHPNIVLMFTDDHRDETPRND